MSVEVMTRHIGIVACTAEGAALCYRTICLEAEEMLGAYAHPEVTMHTYSLQQYLCCIEKNDWNSVADLMISSAMKLAKAGADFIICPNNTIHHIFDEVVRGSPVEWLHIAEEVADEARRQAYRRVGVLGTRLVTEGRMYSEKLSAAGIDHCLPDESDRLRIDDLIRNDLIRGQYSRASRAYFSAVINRLHSHGCDAIVLGCTELSLLLCEEDCSLPLLDSTRLLARAALRRATGVVRQASH